jgi:hypothetical protein
MPQNVDFIIVPVSSVAIERARPNKAGTSRDSVVSVIAAGGEPLRCCLTNARSGEALILFNYEPPLPPSPYRERGAVFAHAAPCFPEFDPHAYPAAWRGRAQVLRAYDCRGWIHAASVHDGTAPEAAICAMLEDRDVVELHSRNVAYGCFMFAVRRAAA